MSVTKDFEDLAGYGLEQGFYVTDVLNLLAHARALEEMLKTTFEDGHIGGDDCVVCGSYSGHTKDCQLAKLLEGVGEA